VQGKVKKFGTQKPSWTPGTIGARLRPGGATPLGRTPDRLTSSEQSSFLFPPLSSFKEG